MVDWTVAPMTGTCRAGMQKSFQLAGNKVWWAERGGVQRAWRCVFGSDGRPLRSLTRRARHRRRSSPTSASARVVASGKRY